MDARTEALQDAGMDTRLDRDMSNCSIARTLEVVGEKWTILILREVWCGSSRFSDFERVLGCSRNLLATRLRTLVEEEILATDTYKELGSRSRPKYVITSKGMDLVPAVMGLMQWGDRYRPDPVGPGRTGATPRMRRARRRPDPLRTGPCRPGGRHRERPGSRVPHEARRVS